MPEVCPRFYRYWIWREMESAPKLKFVHKCMIVRLEPNNLRSVYMRKLAQARVSYRDDFLISFHVYTMTGSFHISFCEGTLHVNKIHMWFKIGYITHALPVPVYGRPISHRNVWSFRVYMIPLRDFVPEWDSRPGTTTGVNSHRHGILWWCHVNKCRAISIADVPDGTNSSFHLLGMIADHRRNLGRVGKIETVPIIQICPRPSQTIGDIYDFEFSLVSTEI